ncbi:MAG: SCO family protein [Chloroflexi bacterium]|nr:MAG: SCO family protein [Chloroflexota bacterium]
MLGVRTTGPQAHDRAARSALGKRIAFLVAVAMAASACAPGKLVGQPLPSPVAPNFVLTDGSTGETVELASRSGHVVLLTFLYTQCVDTCPLTAETIRNARDKLGDAAKDVDFLAVSVDPIGDTPATARQFVQDHRLSGVLRYLIGPRDALARVWQAYGVAQGQAQGSPIVAHTDVIYLVDRHIRGRVVLHSDVTVDDLATDLRILASER